jgi:hypothetical protein
MHRAQLIASFVALSTLAGCCAFVPCHPGTWVVGAVTSSTGQQPAGAEVSLYGSKSMVGQAGCIREHRASAEPLALSASAPGYKSVSVPARFGFYRLVVNLAKDGELGSSNVTWVPISEQEFTATPPCR